MRLGPFLDEIAGLARQLAVQDSSSGNIDLGLILGIDSVKMRRRMVALIHVDGDPVKLANARHRHALEQRVSIDYKAR
jgi:hypothetical protein